MLNKFDLVYLDLCMMKDDTLSTFTNVFICLTNLMFDTHSSVSRSIYMLNKFDLVYLDLCMMKDDMLSTFTNVFICLTNLMFT